MARNEETSYSRQRKGAVAEEAAVQYLQAAGYTIVARNWRCRSGELDLVAEYNGEWTIVEVRSRSLTEQRDGQRGTPEESVDGRKIRQVQKTAAYFLHARGEHDRPVRFDVIAVRMDNGLKVQSLHHIRDAF